MGKVDPAFVDAEGLDSVAISGMLHHPFKETGGMDGIVLNGADVEGGVHQQYTPGDATLPKTLA